MKTVEFVKSKEKKKANCSSLGFKDYKVLVSVMPILSPP